MDLFNLLSRFLLAILPRFYKLLWLSWITSVSFTLAIFSLLVNYITHTIYLYEINAFYIYFFVFFFIFCIFFLHFLGYNLSGNVHFDRRQRCDGHSIPTLATDGWGPLFTIQNLISNCNFQNIQTLNTCISCLLNFQWLFFTKTKFFLDHHNK